MFESIICTMLLNKARKFWFKFVEISTLYASYLVSYFTIRSPKICMEKNL